MALAGWQLTDDFGDAAAEARACRTDCALFDFSFLECARLEGPGACKAIETFAGRSLAALAEKEIFYALRTGPAGDAVADLTIWRTGADSYEVMSGRREDVTDLLACADAGVDFVDMTADRAVLAVQGPRTLEALQWFGEVDAIERLKYFTFDHAHLAGIPCTIGRLGYTGEPGFEIIVAREHASELWKALSAQVQPGGFIAADMLRIEAGFVLFTNEFQLPVSATEAGLGKFSKPADPQTPEITLVSFRADADCLSWPWRPSHELKRPVEPGALVVTSACASVAADGILGLGYVLAGTPPEAMLHDPTATFRNTRLTPRPFYDTAKRRPRAPWR